VNTEIEALYRVFARYRHPTLLDGCPCCTSAAEGRPLLTTPLRALSADALRKYAFKALTTWGTLADYKYFLPRILEHCLSTDPAWEIEVTMGKLAYGEFASWPRDERAVIENFVSAWWMGCIERMDIATADSILCGAGTFMDLDPLLATPQAMRDDFRAAWTCARGDKQRLLNSFWDRDSTAYARVLKWVYENG
jgi:hypothetical protein